MCVCAGSQIGRDMNLVTHSKVGGHVAWNRDQTRDNVHERPELPLNEV